MKILDKYIIKQILATFFYVVIILMVIITVIDITENVDKFSEHHLSTGTIFMHYLTFIPWIAGMLIPITSFIAVVIVTSMMASRTEIIAMLSGGMSVRRLLLSYFIGTSVIAVMSFFLNGWIIPQSNRELLDFKMRYLRQNKNYDRRNMHMQVAPGVFLFLQNYNNQTYTGYQFTMERFEKDRLIEKLTAEYIQWDTLKKNWSVNQWTKRKVDTLFHLTGIVKTPDPAIGPKKDDLVTKGAKLDTLLAISPEDFTTDDRDFDGMTISELSRHIQKLRFRGSVEVPAYEVQRHIRYASPFTIYILAFMGAIVSSRKSRGGTGFQVALGFLLSFIFILFFMMASTMAAAGTMLPIVAAWFPNVVFGLVTLLLYKYFLR